MFHVSAHPVEHLLEDSVDLCLSFTSAGMSERDTLPVASENKSGQFGSNSGQLHLLHPFIVVSLQSQSVTLPQKDMFYSGLECVDGDEKVQPFQHGVWLQRVNMFKDCKTKQFNILLGGEESINAARIAFFINISAAV